MKNSERNSLWHLGTTKYYPDVGEDSLAFKNSFRYANLPSTYYVQGALIRWQRYNS